MYLKKTFRSLGCRIQKLHQTNIYFKTYGHLIYNLGLAFSWTDDRAPFHNSQLFYYRENIIPRPCCLLT